MTLAEYLVFVYGCEAGYIRSLSAAVGAKKRLATEEARLRLKITHAKQQLLELDHDLGAFAHAEELEQIQSADPSTEEEVLAAVRNAVETLEMDFQDLQNELCWLEQQLPTGEAGVQTVSLVIGSPPFSLPCCKGTSSTWGIKIEDNSVVQHIEVEARPPEDTNLPPMPAGFEKIESLQFEFFGQLFSRWLLLLPTPCIAPSLTLGLLRSLAHRLPVSLSHRLTISTTHCLTQYPSERLIVSRTHQHTVSLSHRLTHSSIHLSLSEV